MALVNRVADALRKRRNINNTIKILHAMTDAELRDIGLKRGDIETVARGVVDVHRTVREFNGR